MKPSQQSSALATSSSATQNLPGLLSIRDIEVRFQGIVALNKVSFEVERGQICALIGPNGAGKTTLFNSICRVYTPCAGSIFFDSVCLDPLPIHAVARLGIARTFQNLGLFQTLTVQENVLLGASSQVHSGILANALRMPAVRREERALLERTHDALQMLDLTSVADRCVSDLPYGTRKRVELARALVARPKLLLLDEPAVGLNREEVEVLKEILLKIRQQLQVTMLLVEHHMDLVMNVADKIVALDFGKKIAEGTPAEVRTDQKVIDAYLGAN